MSRIVGDVDSVVSRRKRLTRLKGPQTVSRISGDTSTQASLDISRDKASAKGERGPQMARPLRRMVGPEPIKRLLARPRPAIATQGQTASWPICVIGPTARRRASRPALVVTTCPVADI